jgi:hypothetical protein
MYSIREIEDAFFNYKGAEELSVEEYDDLCGKWILFKSYLFDDSIPADKEHI